jgi:altered-inheritance-of-mitochondria protein 13
VAEELKRLQAREESTLAALLEAEKNDSAPDATSSESSAGDKLRGLGRESVAQDLAKLRERLEQRKKMREVGELDEEVDRARGEVVKCLRGKDTRPLDCWREVKAFREGVARLEGGWVEKVVR